MSNMENPGAAGAARGAQKDVQASTPNEMQDSTRSNFAQVCNAAPINLGAQRPESRSRPGVPNSASAPTVTVTRQGLRCYRWDALSGLPRQSWIVKGVLPEGGLSLLVGQSGSRKSFLAIDIGASIARGAPWCGKRVNQGAVLYIAAEGGRGIVERFFAYAKFHALSVAGVPLFVLPEAIDLRSSDFDVDRLIARIADLEGAHGIRFAFIVVDTLNCVMAGGDENTPKDMGELLGNCAQLRAQTGSHVMMVHHLGKDPQKGARGHSSLKAAADTEILVKATGDATTATVNKQRDGVSGLFFAFRAEIVDLGVDPDGDPITSCVLVPDSALVAGQNRGTKISFSLTGAQRKALDALNEALLSDGVCPPQDINVKGGITCVVRIETWRQKAYARGISRPGTTERAKQKAFKRAIENLMLCGYVEMVGEFAWVTAKQ